MKGVRDLMPEPEMPRRDWPWLSDPGSMFYSIAGFARIAASGLEVGIFPKYIVDDSEFIVHPELIGRDLMLVLVIAIRRAKTAGVELDFEALIAAARAEAERWERAQQRLPEPR